MATNLRVHIAPIGFESAQRITNPLIELRADKVYLVTYFRDNQTAQSKLEEANKLLRKNLQGVDIKVETTDVWNLFACIETYRKIFYAERGNHLYVNVSTGSKITAIAGMLSAMLWDGSAYYTKMDYSKTKKGRKGITLPNIVLGTDFLPVYSIKQPSGEEMQVISEIKQANGKIFKKNLIKILQEKYAIIPTYGKDATKSAPHSKLRSMLAPLINEWKFVKVASKGRRSEVILEKQGENALRIFGIEQVINSSL